MDALLCAVLACQPAASRVQSSRLAYSADNEGTTELVVGARGPTAENSCTLGCVGNGTNVHKQLRSFRRRDVERCVTARERNGVLLFFLLEVFCFIERN